MSKKERVNVESESEELDDSLMDYGDESGEASLSEEKSS